MTSSAEIQPMDTCVQKRLEKLKKLNGILNDLPQYEVYPFSLFRKGIPRGAVTEVSGEPGSGKTELILNFLSESTQLRVAWIEEEMTIYPCAFPMKGVDLERLLFVEARQEALWATLQVMRSQVFDVVILCVRFIEQGHLRRLQLCAEKTDTSLILLSETPSKKGHWPIAFQINVYRPLHEHNCPEFQVLKGNM